MTHSWHICMVREERHHSSCWTTVAGFVNCSVGLIFAVNLVQSKRFNFFCTLTFVNPQAIFHSQYEIQSLLHLGESLILSSMPKLPSKEIPPTSIILLPHSIEFKLLELQVSSPGQKSLFFLQSAPLKWSINFMKISYLHLQRSGDVILCYSETFCFNAQFLSPFKCLILYLYFADLISKDFHVCWFEVCFAWGLFPLFPSLYFI